MSSVRVSFAPVCCASAAFGHQLRLRPAGLRRHQPQIHARQRGGFQQRVAHVVARVADVRQFHFAQRLARQMLLYGEQIRQQLGGVELVGQPFHTGTPACSAGVSTSAGRSRDTEYRRTGGPAPERCLSSTLYGRSGCRSGRGKSPARPDRMRQLRKSIACGSSLSKMSAMFLPCSGAVPAPASWPASDRPKAAAVPAARRG